MGVEFTKDAFLGGRVQVFQPAKGFRAGTDSVLLAAALDADFDGKALEIGCGAGGALFPAASRLQNAKFTGLERDGAIAELAERGVAENGFQDRVEIVSGEAALIPQDWQNQFDLVFSNPPFFETGSIKAPGEGKDGAYIESLPLKDWINAMLFALRPKGSIVMIHRATELARILAILERQTGEIAVVPVRSYPGAEAKRVIVKARKGLRSGPMRLLPGIDLFQSKGGAPTEISDQITQDGLALSWG